MYRILLLIFLFPFLNSYPQRIIPINQELNYLFESAVIDTVNYHSSIHFSSYNSRIIDSTSIYARHFEIKDHFIKPIANLSLSFEKNVAVSYSIHPGLSAYFANKKFSIRFNILPTVDKYPTFIASSIDSNWVVPFWGRSLKSQSNTFTTLNFTGAITYSPRNYISLSLGHDKNFIGDGYRSLFLSDHAAPYTYGSLTLQAWRLKYFVMLASLPDIDVTSGTNKYFSKYGVFHYLSMNLSKRINVGFFEAIIWRGKDSITNRGIDPAYLNPFIFYRPVEYSMHSPDNSLLGGSFKIRFWRKTYLYSQVFLDDLMVKEIFSNNGWYGNKYAIQLGLKSYNFARISNLFFQNEINYVKPYTYGHNDVLRNYGVKYQPLAHPMGGNFIEYINVIRYAKNKWMLSSFISMVQTGRDTSLINNYGQNIYKTSNTRPSDFGIKQGQGLKETRYVAQLTLSYNLIPKWQTYLFTSANARLVKRSNSSQTDAIFTIGIKTLLYNEDFTW